MCASDNVYKNKSPIIGISIVVEIDPITGPRVHGVNMKGIRNKSSQHGHLQ